MNLLLRMMLHLNRYWHIIDLAGAQRSGNLNMVADCRNRISECDAELDRLEIQG